MKEEQLFIGQIQPLQNKATAGTKQYKYDNFALYSLNEKQKFDNSELCNSLNITGEKAPYLAPRMSRELIATITKPNALYSTPDALIVVDGTKLKTLDGAVLTERGTLTDGVKSLADFNGKTIIFPDRKYYNYRAEPVEFGDLLVNEGEGEELVENKGAVPEADYITTFRNRVFAVKGDSIYGSKLGDAFTWNLYTVPTGSSDSWWNDVASRGDFTAVTTYNDSVITFKPIRIHELTLRKPPFSVTDGAEIGALSQNSVVECGGILYFAASDGIYSYTGGMPRAISQKLDFKALQSCVLGSDNKRVYCSLYDGTKRGLYVYHAEFGTWTKEDDLNVFQFCYFDSYLYALCTDGKLYKFRSGNETINWYAETGNITCGTFEKKESLKINARFKIESGELTFSMSYDDGEYAEIKTFTEAKTYSEDIPIKLNRADRISIKISGKGYSEVYKLEFTFTRGSDYGKQ